MERSKQELVSSDELGNGGHHARRPKLVCHPTPVPPVGRGGVDPVHTRKPHAVVYRLTAVSKSSSKYETREGVWLGSSTLPDSGTIPGGVGEQFDGAWRFRHVCGAHARIRTGDLRLTK
jgi:hypothetical protein